MSLNSKNIVLFDGVCNLCSFSVQFIIARDPKAYFHFTAIESAWGEKLLKEYGLEGVDSLILIKDNQAYIYSDAVLHIAKGLSSWHRHIYFFRFIPRCFRDGFYRLVSKFRYNIFGKTKQCIMPTSEIESRFLEEKKV